MAKQNLPSGPGTLTFLNRMGWDAGNASMRAAGRTQWNDDDCEAAQAKFEGLVMLYAQPFEAFSETFARLYAESVA